jgi:hypothetical protein
MKIPALLAPVAILVATSCNSHKQSTTSATVKDSITKMEATKETIINKDSVVVDTAMMVNIDGTLCQADFLHRRYDDKGQEYNADEYELPVILRICRVDNKVVIFEQQFDQNEYGFEKHRAGLTDTGKLFLWLRTNTGGPGLAGTLYQVTLTSTGKVTLPPVLDYGELSRFVFNRSETEILKLSGDWNFDEDDGHFGDHRQRISKYELSDGKYREVKIGETKYKYSSESDLEDVLKEINKKEPGLLKEVNMGDFSFDGN